MNSVIESAFADFMVPVSFLFYPGHAAAYVTYQETDIGEASHAEDDVDNYKEYYDFDVFCSAAEHSKYFSVIAGIHEIMHDIGFMWEPTRDSSDLFEPDTGYFHKTICFSIERSYILNG